MRRVPVVREDLQRFSSHGVVAHQPAVTLQTGECVLFADGEQHDTTAVTRAALAIMQWRAGST